MNKTFIPDSQIVDLVKRGNTIATSSDFSKYKSIGKKAGLDLTHGWADNAQLWFAETIKKMDAEPATSPFRMEREQARTWHNRYSDRNIIFDYIRYLKLWDDYTFLTDKKWAQLHDFVVSECGQYGIDSFGAESIYFKNGGDYHGHISKHSKAMCDKSAIATSEKLKSTLDELFKGLTPNERLGMGHLILNYAVAEIDIDTFHNKLFAGQ